MNTEYIDNLACILWDYLRLQHVIQKSDFIIVLGGSDLCVAEHAAQLYLDNWGQMLVFSGKVGERTRHFRKPESEVFSEIAIKLGVPAERIILESNSRNTSENLLFSFNILNQNGYDTDRVILVSKPYIERRTFATFQKYFPNKECIVSSPPIQYHQYYKDSVSREILINLIVGTIQRIEVYSQRGFQVFQEIPHKVQNAYIELRRFGYESNLIT
jgi:uncharacterized SAM-binding protein YcdF (DUF218 family)